MAMRLISVSFYYYCGSSLFITLLFVAVSVLLLPHAANGQDDGIPKPGKYQGSGDAQFGSSTIRAAAIIRVKETAAGVSFKGTFSLRISKLVDVFCSVRAAAFPPDYLISGVATSCVSESNIPELSGVKYKGYGVAGSYDAATSLIALTFTRGKITRSTLTLMRKEKKADQDKTNTTGRWGPEAFDNGDGTFELQKLAFDFFETDGKLYVREYDKEGTQNEYTGTRSGSLIELADAEPFFLYHLQVCPNGERMIGEIEFNLFNGVGEREPVTFCRIPETGFQHFCALQTSC